ncbi:kinase [Nocardiopsis alba]|uniref:kinase n=1 Tax=Nocardiopsis alba TaxID=53437 RepID=UPI0035DF1CBB
MTSPTTPTRIDRRHLPPGVAALGRKDPTRVGPYRTLGVIRRDAAGATLLAEAADGALASVRLLPAEVADGPDARARLAAEADRLSRARALGLAGYRDADLQAAEPWLATEYVPGRTLGEHIAEHGPLRGETLTALAAGTAEALAAWHALGGLHLALDPSRVVLSPRGPKIVDPGISFATGRPLGDGRWAAPERRTGEGAVDGSADVFAWGLLVRYAATGWESSGETVDEPALAAVLEPLASTIGGALRREPGERPTALRLLEELTPGSGGDLGRAVSDLLAGSWTGMTAPEPRRVRRPRTPVWVGAASVVLVGALVGGLLWIGDDSGGPLGALGPAGSGTQDTREGTEGAEPDSAPIGPTIVENPEDAASVVEEARELALTADSFTTYEHRFHNSGGDSTPYHYFQTWEPAPVITSASYLGPLGFGVMASGPDLERLVYFRDSATTPTREVEREHYREIGPDTQEREHPREQWEALIEEMSEVLRKVELVYEGHGTVPTEYMPPEMLSEEEVRERTGHHYSATYIEEDYRPYEREYGPLEATMGFWADEDGLPIRFERKMVDRDIPGEFGDFLEPTHLVEFARFDEEVEIHIPAEDEILPELS